MRRIKPFEEYPKVKTTIKKLRYSKSGVYLLYNPDGLQYVGQSDNVARRIKEHPVVRGSDRSLWTVEVVKIPTRRWRFYWERVLIEHYAPPMNRQRNPDYKIVKHTYILRRDVSEVFPDD